MKKEVKINQIWKEQLQKEYKHLPASVIEDVLKAYALNPSQFTRDVRKIQEDEKKNGYKRPVPVEYTEINGIDVINPPAEKPAIIINENCEITNTVHSE